MSKQYEDKNTNHIDWKQTLDIIKKKRSLDWGIIAKRLKDSKCLPIIHKSVVSEYIFNSKDILNLLIRDAKIPDISYFSSSIHLASQYSSILLPDSLFAKEAYLNTLKFYALIKANSELQLEELYTKTVIEELTSVSVTEFALRLFPPTNKPLITLTQLPFDILITTDYHTFLERYIELTGKKTISLSFPNTIKYSEIKDKVLVYHIFGIDTDPNSLIITNDDYMNFLVSISKNPDLIPEFIINKIYTNSVIMLGFDVMSIDFTSFFNGVMLSNRSPNSLYSMAIQCDYDNHSLKEYTEKLFKKYNFGIYWGSYTDFINLIYKKYKELLM